MSKEEVWPNFYIVGAARCGTTSLYDALRNHPQVFLPEVKEPHYFTYCPGLERIPTKSAHQYVCCNNPELYQRLYRPAARFPVIGDSSPSYLWDEGAPRKIREVAPRAKIIIILRDPVVRAHSQYLLNYLNGVDAASTFEEALRRDGGRDKSSWMTARLYVEAGLYYNQVRRYLETFGANQVRVFRFSDLTTRPTELFSEICRYLDIAFELLDLSQGAGAQNAYKMTRFPTAYRIATHLGLRKGLLPRRLRSWLGRSSLLFDKKKPSLDERSRMLLQNVYDPDIASLERLLGRKCPELRQSWT